MPPWICSGCGYSNNCWCGRCHACDPMPEDDDPVEDDDDGC